MRTFLDNYANRQAGARSRDFARRNASPARAWFTTALAMLRACLQLLRPANVATALADVLAGFAIAGLGHRTALPWLLLATASLYAGGVVLNDVFDRDIDRLERPERPIPSGRIRVSHAAALGAVLLVVGIAAAAAANTTALIVALAIAGCVLLYDAWGKRHAAVAPLNMAMCRALNLLLGVAAVPAALAGAWPIAAVPLLYIYAVTAISRGEVHGGSSRAAASALIVMLASLAGLLLVVSRTGSRAIPALILVAALAWRVVPAFVAAVRQPYAGTIRAAVKRGVLSLVLLDAALAAAFAGPIYAAGVLATGLVAGWLARAFAVT
jgi:4-hydroxybenzoate polyprenyltransferase